MQKKLHDDDDEKYLRFIITVHYTGKYRGATYIVCNLRYKTPREILVALHNSKNYDYHFIIRELTE